MPSLRRVTCQVLWPEGTAFKEYGTTYGDGIVETFLAVPNDKPQKFSIRVKSKGFIYEGLAVVVFVDGMYQCNRNRVNLVRPKKNLDPERTEIDFHFRQEEKKLKNEGYFLGSDWRFDNFNSVNDHQGNIQDHFQNLGTIDVYVLRCCARKGDDTKEDDCESAAESDVLDNNLTEEADGPAESSKKGDQKGKGNDNKKDKNKDGNGEDKGSNEKDKCDASINLDGPADYYGTPGFYQDPSWPGQHQAHENDWYGYRPQRHYPSQPRRERHVHFDMGPESERPPESRYTDRYETVGPRLHQTPGLSHYPGYHRGPSLGYAPQERYTHQPIPFQHHPQHPPPLHGPQYPAHGYPSAHYPRHPHTGPATMHQGGFFSNQHEGNVVDQQPQFNWVQPGNKANTDAQNQQTATSTSSANGGQQQQQHQQQNNSNDAWASGNNATTQSAPHNGQHQNAASPNNAQMVNGWTWNPYLYRWVSTPVAIPSGTQATAASNNANFGNGNATNSNNDWDTTTTQNNNNADWPNNTTAANTFSNDSWNNPTNNNSNGNSNGQDSGNDWDASGHANGQNGDSNDAVQNNDGPDWGDDTRGNNDNNGDNNNNDSSSNNGWGASSKAGDGGGWGNNDTNKNSSSSNIAKGSNGPTAPTLHGPHGAYHGPKLVVEPNSSTPWVRDEPPRYDVPFSLAKSRRLTKQVQRGCAYDYYKRHRKPIHIDSLAEPYAHFSFKYRTIENLPKGLKVEPGLKPTPDQAMQDLQDKSKEELIAELLRSRATFGEAPPAPPKDPKKEKEKEEEAKAWDAQAPEREFLRYELPKQYGGGNLDTSKGQDGNGGGKKSGTNDWSNNTGGNNDDGWGNGDASKPAAGGGGGGWDTNTSGGADNSWENTGGGGGGGGGNDWDGGGGGGNGDPPKSGW